MIIPGLSLSLALTAPAGAQSGGDGPDPYMGQVATRTAMPWQHISANKQFNARSFHYARDAMTCFQVIYPNFYIAVSPTKTEASPGGPATIAAAVEYPAGVFTQIKFSGQSSGVIADGGMRTSDPVCPVGGIPAGQKFWLREHWTAGWGILWSYAGTSVANGDQFEYAPGGLADKSMGGDILGANQLLYYPVAIIATTRRPAYCLIGDSKQAGAEDLEGDATGDVGETARPIGASNAYINLGSPGDRIQWASQPAIFANRGVLTQYCKRFIVGYGANDLGWGRTADNIEADLRTFMGRFSSKPFWLVTVPPHTASTDSFTSIEGQTPFSAESQRELLNSDMRSGAAVPGGGLLDVTDRVEPKRNAGVWKPGCTKDGWHETSACNREIGQASMWKYNDFH